MILYKFVSKPRVFYFLRFYKKLPDPHPGTKPCPCSGIRDLVCSFSNKAVKAGLGLPASHCVLPSCHLLSQSNLKLQFSCVPLDWTEPFFYL